jgi:hypothetical protein
MPVDCGKALFWALLMWLLRMVSWLLTNTLTSTVMRNKVARFTAVRHALRIRCSVREKSYLGIFCSIFDLSLVSSDSAFRSRTSICASFVRCHPETFQCAERVGSSEMLKYRGELLELTRCTLRRNSNGEFPTRRYPQSRCI